MGFWTTLTRSHLLHDAWRLDTYSGLIAAMVTAAILSVLFEYIDIIKLKVVNIFWPHEKALKSKEHNSSSIPMRLTTTVFYMCRALVVYILMLCIMTMNVWILLTVLLGTLAGNFLKRIMKRKEFSRSDMEVGNNFPGFKPEREMITIVKHCKPFKKNKEDSENELHFELKTLLNKNGKGDTWLAYKNHKWGSWIRRLEWKFSIVGAFILTVSK